MPEFQIDHRGYCFGGIETFKSAIFFKFLSDHRGYCFGGIETRRNGIP